VHIAIADAHLDDTKSETTGQISPLFLLAVVAPFAIYEIYANFLNPNLRSKTNTPTNSTNLECLFAESSSQKTPIESQPSGEGADVQSINVVSNVEERLLQSSSNAKETFTCDAVATQHPKETLLFECNNPLFESESENSVRKDESTSEFLALERDTPLRESHDFGVGNPVNPVIFECINPLFGETYSDADDSVDGEHGLGGCINDADADFENTKEIPSPEPYSEDDFALFDLTPVDPEWKALTIDTLVRAFNELLTSISVDKMPAALQAASTQFAKTLVERASVTVGQLTAAVVFLKRVIKKNPTLRIPIGSGHRIFVVLLLLAGKVVEDFNHSNKMWSGFTTDFSNQDLNHAEIEMLKLVDYEIHVSEKEFRNTYAELSIDVQSLLYA